MSRSKASFIPGRNVLARAAACAALVLVCGCGTGGAAKQETATEKSPFPVVVATPSGDVALEADADSLYSFVEQQLAFGARVPGSEAHRLCGEWLAGQLRAYGADNVEIVGEEVTTYSGERHRVRNVFGQLNPSAKGRVLLVAHYDSRPHADHDPDPALRHQPVPGANDGASGVAVLLEVARVLGPVLPDSLGVDFLMTDLEDSGVSGGGEAEEASWCLGSRQWAAQMPYAEGSKPAMGILLDMVGGTNAVFHRERLSQQLARESVNRVWDVAERSGFGDRFPNSLGGAIVDDHLPLIEAGIPTVDIIETVNPYTGSFAPTWHTTSDNLQNIDRQTLRVVAQTVINTLAE